MDTLYKNIHQGLIDGCREGDRKAQFSIYKLYYKAMYNSALRIINNSAEAEDVMQEAFLDAFQKIDQYGGLVSFGSWLKRIVINKSLDALKKVKDFNTIEENEFDIPESVEEDYLEVLSFKIEKIRKAIENLPDDYRIIISFFLLEGYDHEEISNILGISYNLSRTRFSRAKKKLLESLKKSNVNELTN
ncbi:MAG: sigma-70 family RNA polymerase sigma factor [Bacteroidales bacterium]|nr:sigma-70 family RNA polymerase sigma factor [Bacteroidales bacterium]